MQRENITAAETVTHFFSLTDEKNSSLTYRGIIHWSNYNFYIKIITDNVAYDGRVTEENLAEQCHSLKLTLEKYTEECKKALSNESSDNGFCVTIDDYHFYVKKQLNTKRPSSMKIKFLKVSLQRVDFFEVVSEILDSLFRENGNWSTENSRLKNEIKRLEEDNRDATNCLKKITREKIEHEEILLTKFCNLLNEKKRYYQTLLKGPIDDSNLSPIHCPKEAENLSVDVETKRLDDLYNADTDDENEASNDPFTTDSFKSVKMETNVDTDEVRNIPPSIDLHTPIKMELEVIDERETREDSSTPKPSGSSTSSVRNDLNSSISRKSKDDCCNKSPSSTSETEDENTSEAILNTEAAESVDCSKSSSRVANMLDTMRFLDPTIPF